MSRSVVPPPVLSEEAIRRLLIERVDERCLSVGMVVGVTETNRHRIVAHGYRETSGTGPVNEKTLFEIGSITKLFTALLLSDKWQFLWNGLNIWADIHENDFFEKITPARI